MGAAGDPVLGTGLALSPGRALVPGDPPPMRRCTAETVSGEEQCVPQRVSERLRQGAGLSGGQGGGHWPLRDGGIQAET